MTTQVSMSGGPVGRDGRPGMLAQVVEEVEEDFEPSLDPLATAALARAITDSEDEGTGGTPSIPNLSKEPSIDSSDDGMSTGVYITCVLSFGLDLECMAGCVSVRVLLILYVICTVLYNCKHCNDDFVIVLMCFFVLFMFRLTG